ncbi:ATP-binding cassette domain-containing protein [Streptomyces sp. NBC_01216]|uniref:ATP-binding cassette domain-containing protein n=1 Tax=Streptomyces sp. NBC_01216 TaxID=2903778 RepID=UPI003FA37F67
MTHRSGIRFDAVTVAYGRNTVLDAFDLSVEPGEVMALLGPFGSGKTTALRAVAGFVQPLSGRVFIGDRHVTGLPPYKRGIGMVVQQYALFPHLSVDGERGLRPHGPRDTEARDGRAGRRRPGGDRNGRLREAVPRELSGGRPPSEPTPRSSSTTTTP